ncbi:ankyrin [Decorospora gaudefroyi]|uniref:Ankyrin n=1 Tax=Decorospora gaudefroyi TaxID=184978 RepID=A0A6A5JZS3_9PLEO|nr:ankyrin [Decorospora gaudefroyi]
MAIIQNNSDPLLSDFLKACTNNDAALALQLAPEREPALLTFGLNDALRGRHFDLATQLVKAGARWDTFTVQSASRSPDGVRWLVESGYDVNTSLVGGTVLLPMVVTYNDEVSIPYLLEQGANPNLGPLMNPRDPGPMMNRRPVPNSCVVLNQAASTCTPEIFALLLAHGANIANATPLHNAAAAFTQLRVHSPICSRVLMLEYLVGLGLDVNALDDARTIPEDARGRTGTPLTYAIQWSRVEEARWLLEHGADPDKKSTFGWSARDQAKSMARGMPPDHEMAVLFRRFKLLEA